MILYNQVSRYLISNINLSDEIQQGTNSDFLLFKFIMQGTKYLNNINHARITIYILLNINLIIIKTQQPEINYFNQAPIFY